MDCFLSEGIETIFRIALTLLMIAKHELLLLDMEGVIKYFQVLLHPNPKKISILLDFTTKTLRKYLFCKDFMPYSRHKLTSNLLGGPVFTKLDGFLYLGFIRIWVLAMFALGGRTFTWMICPDNWHKYALYTLRPLRLLALPAIDTENLVICVQTCPGIHIHVHCTLYSCISTSSLLCKTFNSPERDAEEIRIWPGGRLQHGLPH